jgi:alkylation response protein AidB-like acyl-CoA dehydrogenase
MDFAFTEEQSMIAELARDFAKKEIAPHTRRMRKTTTTAARY